MNFQSNCLTLSSKHNLGEQIFSIKNRYFDATKIKIVSILGIKIKIRCKEKNNAKNMQNNSKNKDGKIEKKEKGVQVYMLNNIIAILGIIINIAGFAVAFATTQNKILCAILAIGIVSSVLSYILITIVNKKNQEEKEKLEKRLAKTPIYEIID